MLNHGSEHAGHIGAGEQLGCALGVPIDLNPRAARPASVMSNGAIMVLIWPGVMVPIASGLAASGR